MMVPKPWPRLSPEREPEPIAEMLKEYEVSKDLTPADLTRCQAEELGGSFMTFGPRPWIRCKSEPCWIAIENFPGHDCKVGSMSLCQPCKERCEKEQGGRVRFSEISLTQRGK